jgi:hypothetical protein
MIDKIEIIGDTKEISIRTALIVKDGDEEIAREYSRRSIGCVMSSKDEDGKWTHVDTDISAEADEVKAVANLMWTDEVKTLKKTQAENSI